MVPFTRVNLTMDQNKVMVSISGLISHCIWGTGRIMSLMDMVITRGQMEENSKENGNRIK